MIATVTTPDSYTSSDSEAAVQMAEGVFRGTRIALEELWPEEKIELVKRLGIPGVEAASLSLNFEGFEVTVYGVDQFYRIFEELGDLAIGELFADQFQS